MIERKAQSRKIKNEIGEVIERSYDARGDMVEGIKGWNIQRQRDKRVRFSWWGESDSEWKV